MRWTKGQSGNPRGRPRIGITAFNQRCREFVDEQGWSRLVKLAGSGDENVALKALMFMADHAYGKPQQRVDLTSGGLTLIKRIDSDDAELLGLPPG